MALYVGEAVAIRAQAVHPFTQESIVDLAGTVDFYAPGKDPKKVPADRNAPDVSTAMVYDVESDGYVAFQDTTAFVAGKWTYRVRLTGALYDNFEFGTFALKE